MKIPAIKPVLVNKSSICLKVTVPGTTIRKFKKLDIKIDPAHWDSKSELVKRSHPEADTINATIIAERTSLKQIFEIDKSKGVVFTVSHIEKRMLFHYYDPTEDFYAFCTEQVGIKDYSKETRRTYYAEITKMQLHSPSLSFADISYQWLQQYENYMRNKLANHDNTVWKSLKFINTMLNTAIKIGGLIKKNPFSEYKRGAYKQGIPVFLEWSEVQELHKTVTGNKISEQLRLIGYYTLLSYYSGLRFGDAINFKYADKVQKDSNGKRLVLYASKNNELVSIAFNKYIDEVVNYIKDKPLKITNQEFNESLKILAGIAGIVKEVSSHTARHSFAMRCAELGISIERTQKLMGHAQRKSTEIYYRVKNASLDNEMKKWE